MSDLREMLFAAELESRPHAENPDDLLDEWLIPVFVQWQEKRQHALRARIEALPEPIWITDPDVCQVVWQEAVAAALAVFDD